MFDSKLQVFDGFLSRSAPRVFGRQNLNGNQWRAGKNSFRRRTDLKYTYVGNEEMIRGNLDSLFRKSKDTPGFHIVGENGDQNRLQEGMFELAQVALHDYAVFILTIGLVAGGEVFLHGNEPVANGLRRHRNSILL